MIPIKTEAEIEGMRKASLLAAIILKELIKVAKVEVSTLKLDQVAAQLMQDLKAESACYRFPHSTPNHSCFPGHICVSINNEVVHGIGRKDTLLKDGDIVSIDVCVKYNGFIADTAKTIGVGTISKENQLLLDVSEKALNLAILQARPGKRVGDISHAVQSFVENKHSFSVVRDFVGHGIGKNLHEEPQIPNFGKAHTGPKLYAGVTLAIEPMVNMGKSEVFYGKDGWTVLTQDGLPSAHFEHTVLILDEKTEILTL